jgi:vacuolar protein sorting-associated protein 13A/C
MFEALITKVLNKVLGDFIENLSANQLDISLLKGVVNLTNLKIKQDLFASLPLPFALVYGQIGRIHLRIPPIWKMFTEPLVIEISDIMAIVRPKHVKEWSEEVERKEYKLKQRKRLEQQELIYEEAQAAVEMLIQ